MKAAVLHALGEAPRFADFPEPTPSAGEVLVEISAAPLNALDRMIAAGSHYSKPAHFPVVCGVNGVGRLPDGSRVVLSGVRAPFGTMAQRAAIDPQRVFAIPDGVDDALAAAAFNPGLSAWQTLAWRAKLLPGERVLILGATGVTGQLALQFARRLGAGEIVVAGRNRELLVQLRALGADSLIELDQPAPQLEAAFRAAAGPQGFDVIVDYLWGKPLEVL
ncbi:MAG TPA: zinc-binding alcohol dehydrogenase family protein, partial [Polyangiales bacterium]